MGEVKRITIPVPEELKDKLELIAKNQKRSMSANLEHALEVYAALFDESGKMLVPIDSILMGDLSSLKGVTNTIFNALAGQVKVEESREVKPDAPKTTEAVQIKDEHVTSKETESKLGKEKTNANKGKFRKK